MCSSHWPTEQADVNFVGIGLTCCGPCTYSGKCYGGSYFSMAPLHSCSSSESYYKTLARMTFADTRYQGFSAGPDTEDQITSMLSLLGLPSGCEAEGGGGIATALTRVSYSTVDLTSIVNGPFVPTSTSPIPASTSWTILSATSSKFSVCTPRSRCEFLRNPF